jgi:hypothetical protein
MTVPRYAEAGLWSLGLYLPDLAGNGAFKDSTALEAAGLPSTIGVSKQLIGTVPPGGSATTDVEANGPTPTHPVETTLTTPVGGAVVLTETFNTMPTPGGYSILGQQIDITASPGTPADPLVLTFDFDASIIPPGTPLSSMTIFRNGVAVPDCTGPAGQAVPDPCVQSRTLLPGGDVRIVVNTSHASHWNFGFALNSAPLCTALSASPKTLWPANHKLAPISLAGATDPDGDSLSYLVTGVTQDEAIDGLGDGDASPDAVLTAAGKLLLRAERSGKGDGRVYRIAVEVSDGHGGMCTGTATVSVPKAQNGTAAKDSGGSFDSLG